MDSQIASYSLLYAEDDQWLAEPIIASLQKDGYEVIYAHDGFDALAKYRRLHPDIILLDIRMPGLDGYEVAKEIRKEDPGVPILFLTVLSDPKDAIKGLSVGADDYIRKSVAVEELKARLISKLRNQRPKLKRILDITPRTTLNTVGGNRNDFAVYEKCRSDNRFIGSQYRGHISRRISWLGRFRIVW